MIRRLLALLCAIPVTLGLFSVMVILIETADQRIDDKKSQKLVEIIMSERSIETHLKEVKPDKPQGPQEQPDMPAPITSTPHVSSGAIEMTPPSFKAEVNISRGGWNSGEGDFMPIFTIPPKYPRRAERSGITGYVVVKFTVTKNGSVRNPQVIESKPNKIFDAAAIKAVAKYKFKPRVIEGEALEVAGVTQTIKFGPKT